MPAVLHAPTSLVAQPGPHDHLPVARPAPQDVQEDLHFAGRRESHGDLVFHMQPDCLVLAYGWRTYVSWRVDSKATRCCERRLVGNDAEG